MSYSGWHHHGGHRPGWHHGAHMPRWLQQDLRRFGWHGLQGFGMSTTGLGSGPQAVGAAALADVTPWNYITFHTFDASEVYVVRLKCSGLPISDSKDALLFVKALGVSQSLDFDIRGVAIWQMPDQESSGSDFMVDIIATVTSTSVHMPWMGNDAQSIARKIQSDQLLRGAFPDLSIDIPNAILGELVSPPAAVDFWHAQPILWDHALPGPVAGRGGPTNSYAAPAPNSIVHGKADDGALAMAWPVGSTPILPSGNQAGGTDTTPIIMVLGLAAIAGAGYLVYRESRGRVRA